MTYTDKFLNSFDSFPDSVIYLLLGLSAFLENLAPPLPGDTITAFGALFVGMGRLSFFWVYLSTTTGSLIGFLSLFWLGSWLGRRFFIESNYRFFKAESIIKAEKWFSKYGYFLIAFNRFFPGIRSVISLACGISGLKLIWVTLLALVSSAIWNLLWMMFGFTLGSNWETVEAKILSINKTYNMIFFSILGLITLVLIIHRFIRKKNSNK